MNDEVARFLAPGRLWSRNDVLAAPSALPCVSKRFGFSYELAAQLAEVAVFRDLRNSTRQPNASMVMNA